VTDSDGTDTACYIESVISVMHPSSYNTDDYNTCLHADI